MVPKNSEKVFPFLKPQQYRYRVHTVSVHLPVLWPNSECDIPAVTKHSLLYWQPVCLAVVVYQGLWTLGFKCDYCKTRHDNPQSPLHRSTSLVNDSLREKQKTNSWVQFFLSHLNTSWETNLKPPISWHLIDQQSQPCYHNFLTVTATIARLTLLVHQVSKNKRKQVFFMYFISSSQRPSLII